MRTEWKTQKQLKSARKTVESRRKASVKDARRKTDRVVNQALKKDEKSLLMTEDFRLSKERISLKKAWQLTPGAVGVMQDALKACQVSKYQGELTLTKIPDHFMRLQAADRIIRLTLQPIVDEKEQAQQVIIFNAVGGAFRERLAAAGWTGELTVPMPEVPK